LVASQDSHGALVIEESGRPINARHRDLNQWAGWVAAEYAALGLHYQHSGATIGIVRSTGQYKIYESGWRANQYMRTVKLSTLGAGLSYVGIPLSVYSDIQMYYAGEISGAHAGLNLGVTSWTAYAPRTFGPYGLAYTIADKTKVPAGIGMLWFAEWISPNIELPPPGR